MSETDHNSKEQDEMLMTSLLAFPSEDRAAMKQTMKLITFNSKRMQLNFI